MPDSIKVVETPPAEAVFSRRWSLLARFSALLALVVVVGGAAYSRESGFLVYAALFGLPYLFFLLWPSGRRWQAWGYALAWVIGVLALAGVVLGGIELPRARHVRPFEIALLGSFVTLLLSQVTQIVCVRRASPGAVRFGRPIFRTVLYYACLLLVVGATLPNWYVAPSVRRESKAVHSLLAYGNSLTLYVKTVSAASYPTNLADKGMPALDPAQACVAPCEKDGYRFEYHPAVKDGQVTTYTISARPLEYEESGSRSFLLTSEGKIYWTKDNREARTTDAEL